MFCGRGGSILRHPCFAQPVVHPLVRLDAGRIAVLRGVVRLPVIVLSGPAEGRWLSATHPLVTCGRNDGNSTHCGISVWIDRILLGRGRREVRNIRSREDKGRARRTNRLPERLACEVLHLVDADARKGAPPASPVRSRERPRGVFGLCSDRTVSHSIAHLQFQGSPSGRRHHRATLVLCWAQIRCHVYECAVAEVSSITKPSYRDRG
jgi:hypothetical protein